MSRLLCILSAALLGFAAAQHATLSPGASEELFTLTRNTASLDHEFVVPDNLDSLYVGLAFEDGVTVLLTDPAGVTVPPAETDLGGVQFLVPEPVSGLWRLTLMHDQSAERVVVLEIFHNGSQAVKAGLVMEYTHIQGQGVSLSVAVFRGNDPVTDASVMVDLQRGTEPVGSVPAYDNGDLDNADATAGDGLYSAFITGLEPGFYMAMARAGLPDGASSGSFGFFQVFPVTAALTGQVSDAGMDDDGDLLIDRIELTIGVDVEMPGEYGVMVLLRASNGNEAWTKNGYAVLDTDSTEITTELSARDFKEKFGVDGPFEVKNVRLLWTPRGPSIPSTHIASELHDHGWTAAYELDKLRRPYLIFTRYLGDEGIDLNGNGLFDVIRVSFEFDSAIVGTHDYSWYARLMPDISRPLKGRESFARNQGTVSFGANTFTLDFPVEEYGLNGLSGPYLVTQLSIHPTTRLPGAYGQTSGNIQQAEKPRIIGITQAYSASQLEGSPP